MRRTLAIFTGDEVIVADLATASMRPGAMTTGIGYERAVTDAGDLMFAIVPCADAELVSSLGVPARQVEPGAVLIEAVGVGPDKPGGRVGEDYVLVVTPTRVVVVAADASGAFSQTVAAASTHRAHVDDNGALVFASFRWDADEDWWSWLADRGIHVYPSLYPPLLYLQESRAQ